MRILFSLVALVSLAGCQTVTVNGQDVSRLTAATAIGMLAIALAAQEASEDPAEEDGVKYACRNCPPPEPVEPKP